MKKLLILLSLIFIYAFIEPYWLKINYLTFKNSDLPSNFDNIKLVFVADIHHGPFFNINRVKKLVSKINSMKPDIVILGGDYVHRDKMYITPCFEELKNIQSKYEIFAVLGNHDHWESADLTKLNMQKSNMKILDNKAYWLVKKEQKIKILGVGDMLTDEQYIESSLADVAKQDFTILISHNPDYIENLNTNKIDLMLSGHTHGG